MYRKKLSGSLTIFHKFISPIIIIVTVLFFLKNYWAFTNTRSPIPMILVLSLAIVSSISMSLWLSYRLTVVSVLDDTLIISDYFKEIRVPLSDVFDVKEMRWMQPYWITIHFRKSTEFGETVMFVPPFRFASFWIANPLVNEIKELVSRSKRNIW